VKFNPRIAICRFAYGGSESSDEENWVIQTTAHCAKNKISLTHCVYDDTPAPMVRNRAVKDCLEAGIDLMFFLDNDMFPDIEPDSNFFDSAIQFYIERFYKEPTVIAAPYCGPPPKEMVYIFRWRGYQSDNPNPDFDLKMYTREEAAERRGREAVAALPTGLMAIDARIFTGFDVKDEKGDTYTVGLRPPYFYYEYKDEFQTDKASTEDVTFSRDVSLLYGQYGLQVVWVDWDSWAGHWKRKLVSKPVKIDPGGLAKLFKEAVAGAQRKE